MTPEQASVVRRHTIKDMAISSQFELAEIFGVTEQFAAIVGDNDDSFDYVRANFLIEAQKQYRITHSIKVNPGKKYWISEEARTNITHMGHEQGYVRAPTLPRGLSEFLSDVFNTPISNFYDDRPDDLREADEYMLTSKRFPAWIQPSDTLERKPLRLQFSDYTLNNMSSICGQFLISNFRRADSLALATSAHSALIEAFGLGYLKAHKLPQAGNRWKQPYKGKPRSKWGANV